MVSRKSGQVHSRTQLTAHPTFNCLCRCALLGWWIVEIHATCLGCLAVQRQSTCAPSYLLKVLLVC